MKIPTITQKWQLMVTLTRFSTSNPATPFSGRAGVVLAQWIQEAVHSANPLRGPGGLRWVSLSSPDPKEEAPSQEQSFYSSLGSHRAHCEGCSIKSEWLNFTECHSCTSACLVLPCAFPHHLYSCIKWQEDPWFLLPNLKNVWQEEVHWRRNVTLVL